MTTQHMPDAGQITEVPLITVKTVKRKHLKALVEANSAYTKWPTTAQMLGYIEEWNAILTRDEAGRIGVYRAYIYTEYIRNKAKDDGVPFVQAVETANNTIQSLPQLFLD